MADIAKRYPDNVAGKYYVDRECGDCDTCSRRLPDIFRRNEACGYSYVYRQPTIPDEADACDEMVGDCPYDAIGADGDATDKIP